MTNFLTDSNSSQTVFDSLIMVAAPCININFDDETMKNVHEVANEYESTVCINISQQRTRMKD